MKKQAITDVFKEVANRYPDKPALRFKDKTYTYSELDRLTDDLASRLPSDLVRATIIMDHTPEMIMAILAVLKRGAAYIPMEPDFPVERIRAILEESGCEMVITDDTRFDETQTVLPDVSEDAPAYILYTSGTTGRPKGVEVLNRNVVNYAKAFHHEFHNGPGDVMLQTSVCTFDIFVEEVFTTLLNGACLAVMPKGEDILKWADHYGATIITGFPYLVQDINEKGQLPGSLRLLISGGDVLRNSYIDKIKDKVTIYNTYGPSETTVCCSYANASTAKVQPDGTIPVGKPVLNVQIRILDEQGNELPTGSVGEICIFGAGVSNGYIGLHEKENEAFTTWHGQRMYRSGDLGCFDESGQLIFLERKDRQIMIRGKRVEPDEVESVIARYPGVKQNYVKTLVDDEGLNHMKAYVVFDKESDLDGLKVYMSQYLTPFMIPEQFETLDALPLTSHGKVDAACLN